MKKYLLVLAMMFGSWTTAHAMEGRWDCRMDGSVSGVGIAFIFGGQILGGEGLVTCTDGREVQRLPVKLRFVSGGLGFDLTWVRSMRVVAVAMTPPNGVYSFTGHYALGATAGATLIATGIQFDTALSATRHDGGVGFEIGFLGRDAYGLGARLQGTFLYVDEY